MHKRGHTVSLSAPTPLLGPRRRAVMTSRPARGARAERRPAGSLRPAPPPSPREVRTRTAASSPPPPPPPPRSAHAYQAPLVGQDAHRLRPEVLEQVLLLLGRQLGRQVPDEEGAVAPGRGERSGAWASSRQRQRRLGHRHGPRGSSRRQTRPPPALTSPLTAAAGQTCSASREGFWNLGNTARVGLLARRAFWSSGELLVDKSEERCGLNSARR